jgi:hypothetical protein
MNFEKDMDAMLTVEESYDIYEDSLYDKIAAEGDYWTASLSFYKQVKEKPIGELSDKQKAWLQKINDSLQN